MVISRRKSSEKGGNKSKPKVRRRGRPPIEHGPILSQDRLTRSLLRLTQKEGLGSITMRRVAEELGVSPKLLYRYATNKDMMIELILDAVVALNRPDVSSPSWEIRLRNIAAAGIRAYGRFRGTAAETLNRGSTNITRPHSTARRELILAVMRDAGLDPEQAQLAFLQFAATMLGTLSWLDGIKGAPRGSPISVRQVKASLDFGLDVLINGIRDVGAQNRGQTGSARD